MKIEAATTEIVSNLSDDGAIGMTIDNESIKYIIGSLTDIYPNKVLACLREYPSNARDSHVEAGQTRPIEVTLPSSFNPNFVVQDWGIGMGRYELEKIYGVYGKSTKRQSDEAIGAYGLGSKSALTLVDSFNLISIKDGKKFTVIINKDKEGVGQLKILSEVATKEPNGVKVTIPAAKPSEFAHLADTFFMSWKPGTVLVNGAEPKHLESDHFEKVGELGYISHASRSGYGQRGNLTISMGGICYKVGALSFEQQNAIYGPNASYHLRQQEIILNAPIGAVTLVPSREEVSMSDKTLDFVQKQTQLVISEFLASIKKKIDTASSRMEAVRLVEQFPFAYSRSEYTWKGQSIPASVPTTWAYWSYNSYNSRKHKYADNDAKLDITFDSEPAVLVNTASSTIENSTIMRHLKSWAQSSDITLGKVYIGRLPDKVDPWMQAMIDAGRLIVESADDVAEKAKAFNKANRKAREVSTEPRDTLRYPVYTLDKSGDFDSDALSMAEIKALDSDLYFLDQNTDESGISNIDFSYGTTGIDTVRTVLKKYFPVGTAIVIIGNNRKAESFLKRMGDIEVRDALKVVEAKITENLRREVSISDELTERIAPTAAARLFRKFDETKIDSEVFSTIVENIKTGNTASGKVSIYKEAHTLLGWWDNKANEVRFEGKEAKPVDHNMVNKFLGHYPMLALVVSGLGYSGVADETTVDSLTDYINKVHADKGEYSL